MAKRLPTVPDKNNETQYYHTSPLLNVEQCVHARIRPLAQFVLGRGGEDGGFIFLLGIAVFLL